MRLLKQTTKHFMKPLKRRDFLRATSGAIGLGALGLAGSSFAQSAAKPKIPAPASEIMAELEATRHRFYNVPPEDGQFLNLMTKATRARRILEIGTANGYSAIWFALALEETGGRLTTIEINSSLVEAAKKNVARAGFEQRVEFLQGNAHEVITTLKEPFELVFIDAEIGGKMDYFRKLHPNLVPPGGLIVVHNVITYRSAMEDYLTFIKEHPEYDTVILSLTMEDGFAVSYRRKK
jgi:caffeoyl-CoA O-methyltransferase